MKHQTEGTELPSGNILDFHAKLPENWLHTNVCYVTQNVWKSTEKWGQQDVWVTCSSIILLGKHLLSAWCCPINLGLDSGFTYCKNCYTDLSHFCIMLSKFLSLHLCFAVPSKAYLFVWTRLHTHVGGSVDGFSLGGYPIRTQINLNIELIKTSKFTLLGLLKIWI